MYGSPLYGSNTSSNENEDFTSIAGVSPPLQTRAPIGKWLGPTLSSLLSSPITFQVIGVMVNSAAAFTDLIGPENNPINIPAIRIIR